MPSITDISPRQSSYAIVNMDGPQAPQREGFHLRSRDDTETFSQFLRDAEALDGTVSNASDYGKSPVRGLYPAHAKLFCAASIATLATLISTVIAGSALAINKDTNDETKLGYVIWLTLSIVSCMAFAGVAFIFWRQRKSQRWAQRRLAFLEVAKYKTELEKKNVSEAANHPRDSRPQVRTETSFALQSSPPATHERAERTERAQSSSAATSSSRATGEGFELQYIRSHMSDVSETEQPLRPITLPPRTASLKMWRHSTEPTLVDSVYASERASQHLEPVQVLTSSTPSLVANSLRTSSPLPPVRIDSQFWESLKPLQPREQNTDQAAGPPIPRPSSQTLPENEVPLLDAHVAAVRNGSSELDFGFSADMELDPDDSVVIHTLHTSSSIDPLPANTPTLLATTVLEEGSPRRDSHIEADGKGTAITTLTPTPSKIHFNANLVTTPSSTPIKPPKANDPDEPENALQRRNSITLLLRSPHRPHAQLTHSLPTEHAAQGSPSPFIVAVTPPTPTKLLRHRRRMPSVTFRERLRQCKDAAATAESEGSEKGERGGFSSTESHSLALPKKEVRAGAGMAMPKRTGSGLSPKELDEMFPTRIPSLYSESDNENENDNDNEHGLFVERGEDVNVMWGGFAFGNTVRTQDQSSISRPNATRRRDVGKEDKDMDEDSDSDDESEHRRESEDEDEDEDDGEGEGAAKGGNDAKRWEGVVPYEGT